MICTATGAAQFAPVPEQPSAAPPAALPHGPEPRFEQLPSGIRLCVIEDDSLPLVSVQLWFRNGSAADPPDRPGMTHLVRTLLAQREPAATALYRCGVRYEARTLRDACAFSSTAPAEAWRFLLRVERTRLEPLRPTTTELAAGLDRVAGEWALRAALPPDGPPDALVAVLFGNHRYARPPEFAGAQLAAATADEVAGHHDRWFAAAQATLFVTGAVSAVEVIDEFKRTFAGLPYRDPLRTSDARPEPPAGQSLFAADNAGGETRIEMVMPAPAYGDLDRAAIDVLMHHLLPPSGGLLRTALAEVQDARVEWRQTPWRDGGLLWLAITWRGATPTDRVLDVVLQVFERAATEMPSPPALLAARSRALAAIRRSVDGLAARSESFAAFEVLGGDVLLEPYEAACVRRAASRDVVRAAQFLAGGPRCILATNAPLAGAVELPGHPPSLALSMPPPTTVPAGVLGTIRTLAPDLDWTPSDDQLPPSRLVERLLSEETRLQVLRVPGAAQVSVRVVLDGPRSHDAAAAAMVLGSSQSPLPLVLDYAQQHGIEIAAQVRARTGCIAARCPPERVPQTIEMMLDTLNSPAEVTDALRGASAFADAESSDYVLESCTSTAPSEIPLGATAHPVVAWPAIVRGRDALRNDRRRRIVVVGDVDAETLANALAVDVLRSMGATAVETGRAAASAPRDGAQTHGASTPPAPTFGLTVYVYRAGSMSSLTLESSTAVTTAGDPGGLSRIEYELARTLIFDPVLIAPPNPPIVRRALWPSPRCSRSYEVIQCLWPRARALRPLLDRAGRHAGGVLTPDDWSLARRRAAVAAQAALDGPAAIADAIAEWDIDPTAITAAYALAHWTEARSRTAIGATGFTVTGSHDQAELDALLGSEDGQSPAGRGGP